jgi:primase-polymerase (primpol)-like protein
MSATQKQVSNTRLATMEKILANVPEELIQMPQWVLYKQEDRGGRLTKVPYQPNGLKAESTNPATWSDCQTAMSAFIRDSRFNGIGFVFTKNDPYVGIDLDKCRDPATGDVEPWATKLLSNIDTYTELSPSGKGFHLIGKGKMPAKGRRKDQIEIYETGRYFTVTGDHYLGTAADVNDIQDRLLALHASVFGATSKPVSPANPSASSLAKLAALPAATAPQAGDQVVLDAILASRDASTFNQFMSGSWVAMGYPSQSEGDLAFAGMLARHTNEHSGQIDRLFRSSGMMRDKWDEQRGANTYGEITIAKALDGTSTTNPVNAFIAQMNQRFAVVKNGNQVRILEEIAGGNDFRLYSKADFDLVTTNLPFPVQSKSAASAWLRNPQRREYDGVVFAPGKQSHGNYNLWRGFAVQPVAGNCNLFWQLTQDAICSGSPILYKFIRRYFAHMVQKPWERPGVALVLRGGQGVGKNTLVETMGSLLPSHFCEVNSVDQLTGRFNAHMRNAILVHANEATWGGNRGESGKLKAMITDATIPIEMKGIDILHIDNYMRLVVSSNNAWPVPVEADDRRFLLLDVAPVFKQNTKFFGALHAQLNSGGREALMHDLMTEDLSGFSPRNKPASPFGADVKLLSADTPTRWLFECLDSNAYFENYGAVQLFPQAGAGVSHSKDSLFAGYQRWCKTSQERYPMGQSQFFKRLRELLGVSITDVRPSAPTGQQRERRVVMSDLEACRREFEAAAGLIGAITWDVI